MADAAFLAEQIRFARSLPDAVRGALTVRIDAAADRRDRTCYIDRLKDGLPGIDIDPSTRPIEGPMRRCRLFVYTYNSSGFLESLARNIPTVMFWNPWYFELRSSAQPYFDLLSAARIFHDTPEGAARHVAEVWEAALKSQETGRRVAIRSTFKWPVVA